MCLTTNTNKIDIAQSDIIVYKIMYGNFISPIHNFKYKLNKLYKLKKNLKIRRYHNNSDICKSFFVGQGFHSYTNKCRAEIRALKLSKIIGRELEICQCTIPEESQIVYGNYDTIVSNQIIMNKMIK